jgi:hypothetical protein
VSENNIDIMLLKFFTLTDSEFSDHMVKYIMDSFIEMSISKVYFTTAITAIVIAIATSTTIAFPNVAVFATPFFAPEGDDTTTDTTTTPPDTTTDTTTTPPDTTTDTTTTPTTEQQQQQQTIHITKHGTNSYLLSGGSSSVGSFDTTYRVLGERSAIRASEDLIISTITDDFSSSPTIGYVTAGNMTSTTGGGTAADTATLPSPFASPEQITERITTELRRVITEAENNTPQGQHVEIKCDFGMTLDDMLCHHVPSVGTGGGGSATTDTTDTTGTGTTGG